jgi:hypothetical protein
MINDAFSPLQKKIIDKVSEFFSSGMGFKTKTKILEGFNRNIEISSEVKVIINSEKDFDNIYRNLYRLNVIKKSNRYETHKVRILSDKEYVTYVFFDGEKSPWVKLKSNFFKDETELRRIPLICREVKKFKPGDREYEFYINEIKESDHYFSFKKYCANFYFTFNNHLYSLSLSIANFNGEYFHTQAEVEYEGCIKNNKIPDYKTIKSFLEETINSIFIISDLKFTHLTKLDEIHALLINSQREKKMS